MVFYPQRTDTSIKRKTVFINSPRNNFLFLSGGESGQLVLDVLKAFVYLHAKSQARSVGVLEVGFAHP
jgi:hypothetical protein